MWPWSVQSSALSFSIRFGEFRAQNKLERKCVPVETNCDVIPPPTSGWSLSFLFTQLFLFAPCCSFYSDVLLFSSLVVGHEWSAAIRLFPLPSSMCLCCVVGHVLRNLTSPAAPCLCGSNVHIYAVNIYIKIYRDI